MKMLAATILLVASVMLCLTLSPAHGEKARTAHSLLTDNSPERQAPDFTLEDMSGNKVALSSFRGKPVLLNFWATWCPYCRKERAHLNTLYNKYRDRDLIIVSVATDSSIGTVRQFLKETPADFIVLFDSNGDATLNYGVGGLPTSVLISREGVIKNRLIGYREWSGESSKRLIENFIQK